LMGGDGMGIVGWRLSKFHFRARPANLWGN
jgi:hypothetical protein